MCNKQLSTGEELYILDEFKFVCKEDYQNNNGRDTILLSGDFMLTIKTLDMCTVPKRGCSFGIFHSDYLLAIIIVFFILNDSVRDISYSPVSVFKIVTMYKIHA